MTRTLGRYSKTFKARPIKHSRLARPTKNLGGYRVAWIKPPLPNPIERYNKRRIHKMKKVIKYTFFTLSAVLGAWMLISYCEALNNSLTIGATVSAWNFFSVLG